MEWQYYGAGPFQPALGAIRRWPWQLQPSEERMGLLFALYNVLLAIGVPDPLVYDRPVLEV